MARAIIITGGNIGDVKSRLRHAQQLINNRLGVVMRCSHMYFSKAWGFTAEEDFWNQAMTVDTDLTPTQLLDEVHRIEEELGRDRDEESRIKSERGEEYSSRKIDIDILYYDDLVLNTPQLTIPHPLMQQRDFVLTPLCEIAPDKVHPVLGKTSRQMRDELAEKVGRKLDENRL